MEYIKEGHSILFYYGGVKIGCYDEFGCFIIGRELRLLSDTLYHLVYSNGFRYVLIYTEEYAWFVDLYNSIAAGNYVIEGELLTKCLDLYYLLEYRWERSRANVYGGNVISRIIYSKRGNIVITGNNEIRFHTYTYKICDDAMMKVKFWWLDGNYNVINDILTEEDDIWRNAFPPKAKSARNCEH
jgi:hypothetical protein